jgi:hypothetical protein
MRKYSLGAATVQLADAIDLWAEAAVLVLARQHVMKLHAKLQVGRHKKRH